MFQMNWCRLELEMSLFQKEEIVFKRIKLNAQYKWSLFDTVKFYSDPSDLTLSFGKSLPIQKKCIRKTTHRASPFLLVYRP